MIRLALALCLAAAIVAQGGTATYGNRGTWLLSASPLTLSEDFSGFAADSSFTTAPVAANGFTLQQVGSGTFRNEIDVPPLVFSDNNGTSNASMFTDYGATTVLMTFGAPLRAWGADFYDALSGEQLDLLLTYADASTQLIHLPANGFFGFTTDVGGGLKSITFQSRTNDAGTGGEGFGLDNVAGAAATGVPEPGTASLLLIAVAAAAALRRRPLF